MLFAQDRVQGVRLTAQLEAIASLTTLTSLEFFTDCDAFLSFNEFSSLLTLTQLRRLAIMYYKVLRQTVHLALMIALRRQLVGAC